MKDNKIIAEFMELPLVPCSIGTEYGEVTEGYMHPKGDTPFTTDGLQYKYSWDWLIPVVQKLIDVYISIDEQDEQDLQQSILFDKVGDVYQIVVEIIEKYNSEDRG